MIRISRWNCRKETYPAAPGFWEREDDHLWARRGCSVLDRGRNAAEGLHSMRMERLFMVLLSVLKCSEYFLAVARQCHSSHVWQVLSSIWVRGIVDAIDEVGAWMLIVPREAEIWGVPAFYFCIRPISNFKFQAKYYNLWDGELWILTAISTYALFVDLQTMVIFQNRGLKGFIAKYVPGSCTLSLVSNNSSPSCQLLNVESSNCGLDLAPCPDCWALKC